MVITDTLNMVMWYAASTPCQGPQTRPRQHWHIQLSGVIGSFAEAVYFDSRQACVHPARHHYDCGVNKSQWLFLLFAIADSMGESGG